jgi:hypothetical protein
MPVIEAENEFVEIILEIMSVQTVVDPQRPDFELGEYPLNPGKVFVFGRYPGDAVIVIGGEK